MLTMRSTTGVLAAGVVLLGVGACHRAQPSRSQDISAHASISVPPGLDSAATARWVADQRRACRGQFFSLFDEGMIGKKGADSLVVFRYEKSFRGVQCVVTR